MVLLTYKMPEEIRNIAISTEFNEFDLNQFFNAKGSYEKATFTYQSDVQKWLDLIRGSYKGSKLDDLKLQKPYHLL